MAKKTCSSGLEHATLAEVFGKEVPLMRALGVDDARLAYGRAGDALAGRGVLIVERGGEVDGPAPADGAVEGLDDADIEQAFDARGLGAAARADAVGEVEELSGELV